MNYELIELLRTTVYYNEFLEHMGYTVGNEWAEKYASDLELKELYVNFTDEKKVREFLEFVVGEEITMQGHLPFAVGYELYGDEAIYPFWERVFGYALSEYPELDDNFVIGFIQGAVCAYQDKQSKIAA